MKRTVFAGMFICAAMLASPVFAAGEHDLCTLKLQELRDKVTTLPATSENTTMEVKRMQASAEAANAANDDKKCITEATQALTRVDKLAKEPSP
jgi:outer membrane murein-binding lipoprotein Lpp